MQLFNIIIFHYYLFYLINQSLFNIYCYLILIVLGLIYFKMGNYCNQICQDKGDFRFNAAPFSSYPQNTGTSINQYQYHTTHAHRNPDQPHPQFAQPVSIQPQVGGVVAEILARQNAIKPFSKDTISGTDLPPYQLVNKGIVYHGQWKDGAPHGFGKVFYNGGAFFQGTFDSGMAMCTDGIFVYPDGTFYRGQIKDSSANGTGILVYRNGQMVYHGTWLNDKPYGHGKEQYKDGSSYVGNFIDGVKEGAGKFRWANGSEYTGQFKDGYMHGEGILKQINGDKYTGTFFRNKKQGKGDLEGATGIYKGHFVDNKKMGEGEFRFNDGRIFKGAFYNDLPQGFGTMKMRNGSVLTGAWSRGENVQIDVGNEMQPQMLGSISERPQYIQTSAVSVFTNNTPTDLASKIQSTRNTYPQNPYMNTIRTSHANPNLREEKIA